VLVSTNQPEAASNLVRQAAGVSISIPDPNDPVEIAYKKLMADDDAAQAEVDKWIRDNDEFTAKGAGISRKELNLKIRTRFVPIRQAYEDFIKLHPNHVRARVAFGSFLEDTHDEEGSQEQWEKALELDKTDPAIYNNLANHYGHTGPVKKAFEFYTKAIELNPKEPIYYHNFGTTVYLFRKDAREYYNISEQQVFDKALELYSNSMRLDPTNFPLASDVAQTYYGIKPTRTDEALKSWTNALSIAHDEIEREGVYLHFARLKLHAERFAEARAHINAVTNDMYKDLKSRLVRNLNEQEAMAKTNSSKSGVSDAADIKLEAEGKKSGEPVKKPQDKIP
jgi:Tfp pilus assembly protein PilF